MINKCKLQRSIEKYRETSEETKKRNEETQVKACDRKTLSEPKRNSREKTYYPYNRLYKYKSLHPNININFITSKKRTRTQT
jgi:hypothetical protein